jgi:hypothetical protein
MRATGACCCIWLRKWLTGNLHLRPILAAFSKIRKTPSSQRRFGPDYSHSIVLGGFELMS